MMRNRFLYLLLVVPLLALAQLPDPPVDTEPASPELPAQSGTNAAAVELLGSGTFHPNPQAGAPKAGQAPKQTAVNVDFIGGKAFSQAEMRGAIADSLKDIESQGLNSALAVTLLFSWPIITASMGILKSRWATRPGATTGWCSKSTKGL